MLNLEGRVVAVNTAILRGFGGSNLGVPAAQALELLKPTEAAAPSSAKR